MKDRKTILVAEDLDSIRFAIKEFLSGEFNVHCAQDGESALAILDEHEVDFLLTDIRMPGMGGLELIQKVHSLYPRIKYALMTAYNVNEFIEFARRHHILNIIPKTTCLDLRLIKTMITKNLYGNIFGVDKYFENVTEISGDLSAIKHKLADASLQTENLFLKIKVHCEADANKACDFATKYLISKKSPTVIRQVTDELVSNALTYGASQSENEMRAVFLKPFDLAFGVLDQKYVVSITDYNGTLTADEILYRLERHLKLDPATELPVGITDMHGRGLFISREELDQIVFNIETGVKTEIIGILTPNLAPKNRSLSIYVAESGNRS